MVNLLDSGLSGLSLSLAGSLCSVPGQDILLSQCFFPPRSIHGYRRIVGVT